MFRNWMRNRLGLNSVPQENPMSPMGSGLKGAGAWLPQENPISPAWDPRAVGFENRPRGGEMGNPMQIGGFNPTPEMGGPTQTGGAKTFGQGNNNSRLGGMAFHPYMW